MRQSWVFFCQDGCNDYAWRGWCGEVILQYCTQFSVPFWPTFVSEHFLKLPLQSQLAHLAQVFFLRRQRSWRQSCQNQSKSCSNCSTTVSCNTCSWRLWRTASPLSQFQDSALSMRFLLDVLSKPKLWEIKWKLNITKPCAQRPFFLIIFPDGTNQTKLGTKLSEILWEETFTS